MTIIYAIITLLTTLFFTSFAATPFPATESFRNHLHNDNNSITEASEDYGNVVHQRPSFVLDPSSIKDISDLVKSSFNRVENSYKTVAARGNRHSLKGQAMAQGGVVINMSALSYQQVHSFAMGVDNVLGYYADVDAGMMWIDVLRETLKQGLAPVSFTDYLYLSVGGTLSNAGIGGQAFLYGPLISNVVQLEVVTGRGDVITCSKGKNPELFFAVLGGLGQFGIITRARIVLHKAQKMTRWVRLIYSDFSVFTKDQEYLIKPENDAASYLEGFLIVNASAISDDWRSSNFSISNATKTGIDALLKNNHGILYCIELAKYYDDQNVIDQQFGTLMKKLNFIPGLNFSRDVSFFDFTTRVINLDTPETGSNLFHPWLNLYLPKSNITDFNKLVLVPKIPTLHQKPDPYIFYPLNKNKWDDRMSAVTPSGESVFYTLGLLHSTGGDYKTYEAFNNDVLSICEKAGIQVKQYLAGYKTQDEWKKHFGPSKWNTFYNRKTKFDPKKMLSPGQGIFN